MNTVLIVDDNTQLARVMELTLTEAEYTVFKATTINEAMIILRHTIPDIMVLDMSLPDGNGLSIVDYMRKTPQLHTTELIVLSGGSHYQQTVMQQGIEFFLQKPVDMTAFLGLVQRIARTRDTSRLQ